MLNEREMQIRLERSKGQKVPMTNYGILIAYTHGILKRSVEIFPEIAELFRRESFTGNENNAAHPDLQLRTAALFSWYVIERILEPSGRTSAY